MTAAEHDAAAQECIAAELARVILGGRGPARLELVHNPLEAFGRMVAAVVEDVGDALRRAGEAYVAVGERVLEALREQARSDAERHARATVEPRGNLFGGIPLVIDPTIPPVPGWELRHGRPRP